MDSVRMSWGDFAWLLVITVASSVLCVHNAQSLGSTFDEPFYLKAGLDCWRSGSNKPLMSAGTMPLPIMLENMPIYVWERCRGERFDTYSQHEILLPIARLGNLPFWWLLLVYGMRWGRLLGGTWGGRFGCGFLAFEPNLLAHAGLATTDISITGAVLATAYHWYTGRTESWCYRVLVPGLWYGFALICKASAFAFVPILFVVLGIYPVWTRSIPALWSNTYTLRWDILNAGLIGLAAMFLFVGSDFATERTFVEWADQLPDGTLKQVMQPVSQNLKIFPNAGEGIAQQIKHNINGHGSYVLGTYYKRACWFYFPVNLSIKMTEPILLLLAFMLLTRPRTLWSPTGAAVLALFLFSFNCRVQIGVRLVFPLVAFLVVSVAGAAAAAQTRLHTLAAWITQLSLIGISVWVGPQSLQYANCIWGGPSRCHEVLTDSNADWGQGLPELKEWCTERKIPIIHVWYYGVDPAVLLTPFHLVPAHLFKDPSPEALRQATNPGLLAVSHTLLDACPERNPKVLEMLEWLKTQPEVGRTSTFVIYKLN